MIWLLTGTGEELDQLLMLGHILDRIVDLGPDLGNAFVPVFGDDTATDEPLLELARMDVDGNV